MANIRVIRRTHKSHAEILGDLKRLTKKVLIDAAERTKTTTVESIIDGAILGEGHIASAPGTAPNADTGELHQSYATSFQPGDFRVTVGSPLAYSKDLEVGTSKIAPRPHLSPAFHDELPETRRNLRKAMQKAHR